MGRRTLTPALLRLAALLALAAVVARPLAVAVWDDYAVRSACPLTEGDLEAFEWKKFHPVARGVHAGGPRDPWGRPFRFAQEGVGSHIYSTGRDGQDQIGQRAGDDVFVRSTELTRCVDLAPRFLLGASLALLWLAGAERAWRARRSSHLAVDLGRFLTLALVPGLPLAALAWWTAPASPAGPSALIVPFPAAAAGSVRLLVFLFAVWLRARHPWTQAERPARPLRPALLPCVGVGSVLLIGAGGSVGRDLWRERWAGPRVLMLAQLGVPEAIQTACFGADLGLRDAILAHPPPTLRVSDALLVQLAALGPEALELMLGALAGPDPDQQVAIDFVLDHDPELRALTSRIERSPDDYEGALRLLGAELATSMGVREVVRRLVAQLERDPFRRGANAQAILELIGPNRPLALLPERGSRSRDDDAVMSQLLSWWRAGAPDLRPLRQLALAFRGAPSSAPQGLRWSVLLEAEGERFLSYDVHRANGRIAFLPLYRERAVTLRVLAGREASAVVPLDVPAEGCTVFVTVDWSTGAHEVRVVRHPD